MQLLDSQSSNGSSPWFHAVPDAYNGLLNIYVAGDFGEGVVKIEALAPDGATVIPLGGGEFTVPEMRVFSAASTVLRATVVGATDPSISVWVEVESVGLRRIIRERG